MLESKSMPLAGLKNLGVEMRGAYAFGEEGRGRRRICL
jgi:hypothetical protein